MTHHRRRRNRRAGPDLPDRRPEAPPRRRRRAARAAPQGPAVVDSASSRLAAPAIVPTAAAADPAADFISGIIGVFISNGADAADDCSGDACNGGNAGLLFGNGGDGGRGGDRIRSTDGSVGANGVGDRSVIRRYARR